MTHKTGRDLINEARARITEYTAAEVRNMRAGGTTLVYLDVREPNEWNLGRVAGAIHIPRGNLETRVETLVPRESRVIVYCANGSRSALSVATLREMGYENAASMSDGFTGWVGVEGDIED